MAEADPIEVDPFEVDTGECDDEEEDIFGGFHSTKPSFDSRSFLKKRKKPETRTEEGPVCIILRTDKKPIPFNFFNKCQSKWVILSYTYKSIYSLKEFKRNNN